MSDGIICGVCKNKTGIIRRCEMDVVIFSYRAHVDCTGGHSQYRSVAVDEILTCQTRWRALATEGES